MHLTLTDQTFNAHVLETKGVFVVDFGAAWCAPCKTVDRILTELNTDLKNTATIYKVDADESVETASKFGVRGLPTVIIFKDGHDMETMIGLKSKDAYLKVIQKVIQNVTA